MDLSGVVLSTFFQLISAPKIADLQAHNVSRDALGACRLAIFGECSPQNRDAGI